MNILQKVKLSSEKQIDWDRLVSRPESPSASLLLQYKEKAKTCNIRYRHQILCDKPMGISDYLICILIQASVSIFFFLFHPCFLQTSGTSDLASKL